MKLAISNYRIFPRVFPCGVSKEVRIIPVGVEAAFPADGAFDIRVVAKELNRGSYICGMPEEIRFPARTENGSLLFSYCFDEEQEWQISVLNAAGEVLFSFPVYSLREDLYRLTPLKGDFHVHSCRSDGKDPPLAVAANYRRAGFDFMALTDHRQWEPSDDLIGALSDVPTDLRVWHGEEVHLYSGAHSIIHIVNFGGSEAVDRYFREHEDEIVPALRQEAEALKDVLPAGVNALEYAHRKWVCDRIRACGGMAIFAHPCWIIGTGEYNTCLNMTEAVIRNGIYDAYEVIGGESVTENNLQLAIYHELRAQGLRIPIVGNSDSHGTDPARWFDQTKTIVFAARNEFSDIRDAVMGLYSVAVETMPGESARVHGPLRLVRYGHFLLKNYYPDHDGLCHEEGRLLKDLAAGEQDALPLLTVLRGRVAAYTDRFFGRNK